MSISSPAHAEDLEHDSGEPAPFVDINVTPLVDVFLVLLVILMATSTALLEAGQGQGSRVPVELPSGSSSEELTDLDRYVVIAISSQGVVLVNGQEVTLDELSVVLAEQAKKDASRAVLVQADADVRHKRVVEVMEAARKAGLKSLSIATQKQ
ncbi:MAG: biopolymer transporter ExbD [Deltaproteobacteria bacterium]|nr:biopolymer transporter ExbD [Deltaproteobacteria bacterium]